MIDFLISVVCYNNEQEIIDFAKKLGKQTISQQVKLVVTCNSCSDFDSFTKDIKKEYQFSEILNPPQNLGYLNGCLYGLINQKESYKWGLISNTDIDFMSDDFFEKILTIQNNDVWCIAPDIIVEGKTHQNPYLLHRPSKIKKIIRDLVFSNYFTYLVYVNSYHKIIRRKKNNENVQPSKFIYAAHGCCFILKKDCINALHKEDNQIFMYDEEFFVAEVIYKNNKKCYFDNSLVIKHNANQTMGQIHSKAKQRWFKQSITYLKKFY